MTIAGRVYLFKTGFIHMLAWVLLGYCGTTTCFRRAGGQGGAVDAWHFAVDHSRLFHSSGLQVCWRSRDWSGRRLLSQHQGFWSR